MSNVHVRNIDGLPDTIGTLDILTRKTIQRFASESGFNLVDGSFEVGGTLVNANDVLLLAVVRSVQRIGLI